MNSRSDRQGLILSSRIIAAHQTATLLEQRGWRMGVEYHEPRARQQLEVMQPGLLVVDIDSPDITGLRLLSWFRHQYPDAKLMAICCGGNSQSMRIARELGIDGYFYLQPHGKALDTMRGTARHCLQERQTIAPLSSVRSRAGHLMVRA